MYATCTGNNISGDNGTNVQMSKEGALQTMRAYNDSELRMRPWQCICTYLVTFCALYVKSVTRFFQSKIYYTIANKYTTYAMHLQWWYLEALAFLFAIFYGDALYLSDVHHIRPSVKPQVLKVSQCKMCVCGDIECKQSRCDDVFDRWQDSRIWTATKWYTTAHPSNQKSIRQTVLWYDRVIRPTFS